MVRIAYSLIVRNDECQVVVIFIWAIDFERQHMLLHLLISPFFFKYIFSIPFSICNSKSIFPVHLFSHIFSLIFPRFYAHLQISPCNAYYMRMCLYIGLCVVSTLGALKLE